MTKTDIKHVTHEDLQALKSHVENLLQTHGKQALHTAVEKAEHLATNAREIAVAPTKTRSRGRSFLAIAIFSAIGYFLGRATK